MNGPLPESIRKALESVTLDDKYALARGRAAFGVLARLKGLRGTAFDPFGHSEERRTERALIGAYRASIDELLAGLSEERLPLAQEIACLPEAIRGYGHVKARHLAAARSQWETLTAQWRAPAGARVAA